MLRRHVPLSDQIEEFFHGALTTLVYLPAGCTHKETFVRRVSLAPTLLARQSLPTPSIIVSGRSTMGALLRSSTLIASLSFTRVLLPGAMILVWFFWVGCSCHTNATTIHFLFGSDRLRFRSAAFDFSRIDRITRVVLDAIGLVGAIARWWNCLIPSSIFI